MKPIAFVIQRYGIEVAGGAEQHCRWLAEKCAQNHKIEVLTTCALDYRTWDNHYEAGVSSCNEVLIRRFPTLRSRDRVSFDALTAQLLQKQRSREEEIQWLNEQGPFCPALIQFLNENHNNYQLIVFYTYLYYPTVQGITCAPDNCVLIPTAHDEPVIYFSIFREVFAAPRAIFFLTGSEREFVHTTFGNQHIPSEILGTGIEVPPVSPEVFKTAYGIEAPYILYAGRIDEGKGCLQLASHFIQYKNQYQSPLKLIFIGKLIDALPEHPDIHYPGFLDETQKASAIHGALAVIAPSRFESLCIAALEGMAVGKPVIANGLCNVLREHCMRSNAGLWYENESEFFEVLALLEQSSTVREIMGRNGKAYIETNYSWERVMSRFESLISLFSAS